MIGHNKQSIHCMHLSIYVMLSIPYDFILWHHKFSFNDTSLHVDHMNVISFIVIPDPGEVMKTLAINAGLSGLISSTKKYCTGDN